MDREDHRFVTRSGAKLAAALDHFGLDVQGLVCADMGSHAGGFVDCLLRRGALRVYSIDTSYGTLAWKLRKDPRVVVLERTNAMHVTLPEQVNLVTIDVGWTRQQHVLPAARRILAEGGRVISLIKPHYEAEREELVDGVLPVDRLDAVLNRVWHTIGAMGWHLEGCIPSPIRGHAGNTEYLANLTPVGSPPTPRSETTPSPTGS